MTTGEWLRGLREDKNLRQKDIAELLKTSQSYYSQYENDKRPVPAEHLKTLALFYRVSVDYLLGLPRGLSYPNH